MKITKDTQTVWKLESGDTIIGIGYRNDFYVRNQCGITKYTKKEMRLIYRLTEDQFDNIEKPGI